MLWRLLFACTCVLLVFQGCADPFPEDKEFACPCKDGWKCVDGTCRKFCLDSYQCPQGYVCTDEAVCRPPSTDSQCTPDCEHRECGNDGCGGICGICGSGYSCRNGVCMEGDCSPNCNGKECGTDGCGGICGVCYDKGGKPSLESCDKESFSCSSRDEVDILEDGTSTCSERRGECVHDSDCASYDDGNPCNGLTVCSECECQVDPATIIDCSDVQAGPCTETYCDEADGECKQMSKKDGSPCDDGSNCTLNDGCADGVCGGTPLKCDDGEECTVDACEADLGCVFSPVSNGTECNDGSLCTGGDHCEDGECVGDTLPACDSCSGDMDCASFEDGNLCNGTLTCIDGQCVVNGATVVECQAPEVCKQTKCNPASGECETSDALDGADCDDANACTHLDFCSSGICKGLPIDCDDVNACTADSCVPDSGCLYEPKMANCGDGDPCTINDHCVDGACVGDPNPTCQCDTDEDCEDDEDDDLCNGTLVCLNKTCKLAPDTVVDCSLAGFDECSPAACEPETGSCIVTLNPDGTSCSDENACTKDDFCRQGKCTGSPVHCDDGSICTSDHCDPLLGCVITYNSIDCDDGSMCTLNDYCSEGFCTGDPNPDCVCQTDADCFQFEDGDECNGKLSCKGFMCTLDPATVANCDKSADTDCLVTFCVPETGDCVQAAFEDGKPCDDANACTLNDLCMQGICTGSGAPQCDDGNVCTNDGCDGKFGCVAAPNSNPCDDGNPCTQGDTCSDGVCQPGGQDLCGGISCLPDWALVCGATDAWGTDMSGASDIVDAYPCSTYEYTGPEYTYAFAAPYDALVTVSLSKEEAETDLFVLEDEGGGCDPEQCRDWDYKSVTFEATAGSSYYFVVDGYEEGVLAGEGAFVISVDCHPLSELDCSDGLDDDNDGVVDCDDDDCLNTPDCPLPHCSPAWTLQCGESDAWANYNFGSSSVVSEYGCAQWDYSGPEYAYVWVAPFSKTIIVKLSEETAETDIMVVQNSAEGACDPDNCVAFGFAEVAFEAVVGTTYYFVVDGWAGAEGSFIITLNCPPDVETLCEDGDDNDQDGAKDCEDADCAFSDACADDCNAQLFPFEVGCGFEEDYYNYSFLSSDKADTYACSEDPMTGNEYVYNFTASYDAAVTVTLSQETAQTDILVVEDEADMGCLTTNCIEHDPATVEFDAVEGELYYLVVDGFDDAQGSYHIAVTCQPAIEQSCLDGLDEDVDGLADCADPDCFPGPDCEAACVPADAASAQIACGSTDSWSVDGEGSHDFVEAYSCNSYQYAGPEYTYTLTVEQPHAVTLALTEEEADTDVMVIEEQGLGCNPASCIAYGLSAANFEAEPGVTYYVVIDGYQGDVGSYNLEVSCD